MVAIKGIEKFAPRDFPGLISATLFIGGCNFRCPYCHNADLVLKPHHLPDFPLDYLLSFLDERKGWLDGVCITGGEPLLDENIATLCSLLKERDLLVKIDTNGSRPRQLQELLEENLVDAVAMDVKTSLSKYRLLVPNSNHIESAIKESIELLLGTEKKVFFRTTVVPVLVEKEDIKEISQLIQGAPLYVLQQFQPHNTLDKSYEKIQPYSQSVLEEMAKIAAEYVGEIKIEEE